MKKELYNLPISCSVLWRCHDKKGDTYLKKGCTYNEACREFIKKPTKKTQKRVLMLRTSKSQD